MTSRKRPSPVHEPGVAPEPEPAEPVAAAGHPTGTRAGASARASPAKTWRTDPPRGLGLDGPEIPRARACRPFIRNGRTGLARLLMGSVADQIVRKAACPVLTVEFPCPDTVPASAALLEGAAR